MTVGIIIILFVIAAAYAVRSHGRGSEKPDSIPKKDGTPFRAVSIRSSLSPCKAARDLAGQRFFPDQAPALPLESCDNANCECRFARHRDRRDEDDRRTPLQRNFALIADRTNSNRREKEGRRGDDDE